MRHEAVDVAVIGEIRCPAAQGKSGVGASFLPERKSGVRNPVSRNPVSVHHSCPKRRTETGFPVFRMSPHQDSHVP